MKDKEMIEEMARVIAIDRYNNVSSLDTATMLYDDLGYRKLPENSVVLSKEEYKELLEKARIGKNQCIKIELETIMKAEEKASKETAEKILREVNEFFRPFDKKSPIFFDLLLTKLETIVKKFGVEIKE